MREQFGDATVQLRGQSIEDIAQLHVRFVSVQLLIGSSS